MPPSFTIYSSPHVTTILIQCDDYYPLSHWMPWIQWKAEWKESYPMETSFRIYNQHIEITIQTLLQKGFIVGPVRSILLFLTSSITFHIDVFIIICTCVHSL